MPAVYRLPQSPVGRNPAGRRHAYKMVTTIQHPRCHPGRPRWAPTRSSTLASRQPEGEEDGDKRGAQEASRGHYGEQPSPAGRSAIVPTTKGTSSAEARAKRRSHRSRQGDGLPRHAFRPARHRRLWPAGAVEGPSRRRQRTADPSRMRNRHGHIGPQGRATQPVTQTSADPGVIQLRFTLPALKREWVPRRTCCAGPDEREPARLTRRTARRTVESHIGKPLPSYGKAKDGGTVIQPEPHVYRRRHTGVAGRSPV